MKNDVVVIKQNLAGMETWRYNGTVLKKDDHSILIEAYFNRKDLPFHGMVFAEGDRFLEEYFTDRWYNIFEIHDRINAVLKGWYCNVTRPAVITDTQISYIDLALDLLIFPDGTQLVLDEDEFERLDLAEEDHKHALKALAELRTLFKYPLPFTLDD